MEILLPRLDGGGVPDFGAYFDGVIGRSGSGSERADQFDDWLPDPIYHEDARLDRDAVIAALEAHWSAGHMETASPLAVQVPRTHGTLHALALPLDLRLTAQAVIADAAPQIAQQLLVDKVIGFAFLPDRIPRFEVPGERASLLDQAAVALLELAFGDTITVMDVSGFQQNAQMDQLERQLRRSGVVDEQITFLRHVVAGSPVDLPSIDDAFAFLYNVYLVPIDNALKSQELNFFRYRDEYFLLSHGNTAPVEQALAALGLSASQSVRELSQEDVYRSMEELANRMTEEEREQGPLEEVIGRLGDGYVFAVFDPLCSSDCFEVRFERDPQLTRRVFFAQCSNGSIIDGVDAAPVLRWAHMGRRSAAWRRPPHDDATADVQATVAELANNRDALEKALATAVNAGVDWQTTWAAALLSDIGPHDQGTVELLLKAMAGGDGQPGAEAARVSLARASEVAASDIWVAAGTGDTPHTRRSRALAAHFLRLRGEPGPWTDIRPLLVAAEPRLVAFMDRL